jgi:hypothetical protein
MTAVTHKLVLVPVEPTDEMLEAMWTAMFNEPFTDQHVLVGAAYDAMLAAAPEPSPDAPPGISEET